MPLAITTDPTSDPTSYDMLAPHQGADGPLHRFHNRRHACPHQGAGGPLHRFHNRRHACPHQGAGGPLHRFHNRRHACPHQGAGGPLHRCHNRCLCFLHRRRDDVCEVDAGVA